MVSVFTPEQIKAAIEAADGDVIAAAVNLHIEAAAAERQASLASLRQIVADNRLIEADRERRRMGDTGPMSAAVLAAYERRRLFRLS